MKEPFKVAFPCHKAHKVYCKLLNVCTLQKNFDLRVTVHLCFISIEAQNKPSDMCPQVSGSSRPWRLSFCSVQPLHQLNTVAGVQAVRAMFLTPEISLQKEDLQLVSKLNSKPVARLGSIDIVVPPREGSGAEGLVRVSEDVLVFLLNKLIYIARVPRTSIDKQRETHFGRARASACRNFFAASLACKEAA